MTHENHFRLDVGSEHGHSRHPEMESGLVFRLARNHNIYGGDRLHRDETSRHQHHLVT